MALSRKHGATLQAIFRHPVSGTIRWSDIEALFIALGAEIEERSGSRIAVLFPDAIPAIFHRPHPSPTTDKGAIVVIRRWLESLGLTPEGG